MKDLRDPHMVGFRLLSMRSYRGHLSLSEMLGHEAVRNYISSAPNYDANPSTLEKYGRPQDLPETPF